MKTNIFINANRRLSIVRGPVVTEIPLNLADARHLLGIIGAGMFDICADEETQKTGKALERLLHNVNKSTIANRHELEARDDKRMRILSAIF